MGRVPTPVKWIFLLTLIGVVLFALPYVALIILAVVFVKLIAGGITRV